MRAIETATVFRKELKKLRLQADHANLDDLLGAVLEFLIIDKPLPIKNRDHALIGPYKGFRDCHIKPDLILIYSKPDKKALWLARIGMHSERF